MKDTWEWWMLRLKWVFGSFKPDDGLRDCPDCKGKGIVDISSEDFDLDVPMMIAHCKTCSGTGEHYIPTHAEMPK